MIKTASQQVLEARRGQCIKTIVTAVLSRFQGRRNIVTLAAADLDISDNTLYRWCNDLGIDIDEYRRPAVAEQKQ